MLDTTDINLPRHVGVIMDGNGRWAKKRGVARWEGHREGARVFRRIGEYAADIGVKYLTFYAFSTENWSRPPEEVAAIMQLFREYLIEGDERLAENEEKGMRLRFIGDRHGLPEDIVNLIEKAERESADKSRVYVNIALNYGGRDEIVESVRSIAERVASGEMKPEDITGDDIA
ncbi:MAG: di-trans,poly-cis-decaprenylcistransferase, partial [Clostridiales bacterium]|nr:di-trans,poly-cis-decaprenylcistransferase [Clostridiales bacterium]